MALTALDELCEGPGCDQPATHLEGGRALCDKPACKNTKQSRFEEKKFSDFEPEEGFGDNSPVRHIPPPATPIEPVSTTHYIHSTACKMYRRFPAPAKGCEGCSCAEIEQNMVTGKREGVKPNYQVFDKSNNRTKEFSGQKKRTAAVESRDDRTQVTADKETEEAMEPKKTRSTDLLATLNLDEALKLYKEGANTAALAKHFGLPTWYFYQSPRWRQAKDAVVRDGPHPGDRPRSTLKADGRHAAKKTPRAVAQKVQNQVTPTNVRNHLQSIIAAFQAKIDDMTKSLTALRDTLAMLDKYPDILP